MMTKLTKAQRARLEKLAAYLEGLPEDYKHFEMADYFSVGGLAEVEYARKNGGVGACGAVACAVGHGPAAGILFPPRYSRYNIIDWNGYASLFVGHYSQASYMWAFAGGWYEPDNSHYGAAARIRYLLDKGVPADFGEEANFDDFVKLYAPYRIDRKEPHHV